MPDPRPTDDQSRIPRTTIERLDEYLQRAIRRLADTPGVETQQLAGEGEDVLLELAAARARDATRTALWGPAGRPSLPSPPRSNKSEPPPIPEEVKT